VVNAVQPQRAQRAQSKKRFRICNRSDGSFRVSEPWMVSLAVVWLVERSMRSGGCAIDGLVHPKRATG
jgi:hypothetical protein